MSFKFAIIEDASFVRVLLRSCFEEAGGSCLFEGASGEIGAAELGHIPNLDIAVIDFVLPKTNGLDLAQKIREKSPTTILIGCTSLDKAIYESRSKDLGFYKILQKPFSKGQIFELTAELGFSRPVSKAQQAKST